MRRIKRGFVVMLAVMLFLSTAIPGYAAEGALDKLGRGLMNTLTGWMEIPKHIYEVSQETNPFSGLLFGSLRGAGMGISRTGYGAADAATFVIPAYDKPILDQKVLF